MGEDAEADRPDEGAQGAQGARDEGAIEPAEPAEPLPPVDRALSRLGRTLGGRPLSVYGVLLAGAAVLLILLAIIWLTAGDGGDDGGPTCLNITRDGALDRISAAEVERLDVTWAIDRPGLIPAALRLETTDGNCHNLQPQGIEGQIDALAVIGAVDYFNQTSDERQIRVVYDDREDVQPEIFWTPTLPPTETVPPTPTVPTPTEPPASPTAVPPTMTPTATPVPPGSPDASPDASPAGSPVDSTATETATPGA